jgi:hypothetical protein
VACSRRQPRFGAPGGGSGDFLCVTRRAQSLTRPCRHPTPPPPPPQVEYAIQDMGYLRFYLAPKIEDEDMEGEDEAP